LTIVACLVGSFLFLRTLVTFRPQVVVLSLKQANIIGRIGLYAFPGTKCISFEHIAELEKGPRTGLYEWLLRLTSKRVDGVWADCRKTLESTRGYFKPRNREETVVPLFVTSDDAPLKRRYELGKPVRIVTAGRLIKRKRIDLLLRSLQIL